MRTSVPNDGRTSYVFAIRRKTGVTFYMTITLVGHFFDYVRYWHALEYMLPTGFKLDVVL